MTLNWHWHGLTPSQKKSVFAGIIGGAAWLVRNSVDVQKFTQEHLPPSVGHWLPAVVGIASLIVAMKSRALDTSNSGTNTGLIDGGRDVWAAMTAAGIVPTKANTTAPPPPAEIAPIGTPAPSVGPPDAPLTPVDVQETLGHE